VLLNTSGKLMPLLKVAKEWISGYTSVDHNIVNQLRKGNGLPVF
jgi:hypothetical protein